MTRTWEVTVTIVGGAWDDKEPGTLLIEAPTRTAAISAARRQITAVRTRWDQQAILYRAKVAPSSRLRVDRKSQSL